MHIVRSATPAGLLLSTCAGLLVTGVHNAQVYFGAPACTLVTLVMLQRGILYEAHWLSHGEANGEGKLDSIELPKQKIPSEMGVAPLHNPFDP